MMERKFTDDEIVEALECCVADRMICEKCPIQHECESNPFDATLARYSLALIKRQKAENSNLTSDLTSLQNDLTSAKAEIERLREEREKLLKECKNCGSKTQKVITKLQKQMRQNKNEAIKEFAERLKAKAMLQHGGVTVVYGSNIDNILKEMTGEDSNE